MGTASSLNARTARRLFTASYTSTLLVPSSSDNTSLPSSAPAAEAGCRSGVARVSEDGQAGVAAVEKRRAPIRADLVT